MASKICDGLLLGSQMDAEAIKPDDVSHILTVSCDDLRRGDKDKFVHKWVNVEDALGQDLLTHFTECINFIDEAVRDRGCLVHCIAGVSRSSTIVIAYLMWKEKLNLETALSVVRRSHPRACPNSGFQYQLNLFERMGCKLDDSNPEYKYHKLTSFARSLREAGASAMKKEDLTVDPDEVKDNNAINYKCRKCRRNLFRQESLMVHNVGAGQAAFDWRGATEDSTSDEKCTKSIFIEPIQWMLDTIQIIEGKILCPKCSVKLGSFNWYGERCPCGRWVTPAFHIDTGKVDKTQPMTTMAHPITK